MRQVWITRAGAPEVLQVRDLPTPEPRPGEVRLAVQAAGVNFADLVGRLGLYPDAPRIPYVPGYEIAGQVDALGPGVESLAPGQDVFALVRFGGYADCVCVPADQVLPRPAGMTVEQAAAFPVSYLTAYAGLVALGGLRHGEHVLIHAAAGGVGQAAVDLARLFEATVYGTASPAKHDFLRARGVHHPLPYRGFAREIDRLTGGRGVTLAMDAIGGRSWMQSFRALGAGGRLVIGGVTSLTPSARRSPWGMLRFALQTPWLAFNPVSLANANKGVLGINLGRLWDRRDLLRGWLDQLLAWYAEGHLRVHVDRAFPLEDAAAAHHYLHERRNMGRVVLLTG